MKILIGPLDTKKKIERPRCPEVGLGILDFIIRTLRRAQEKHAEYIGFPCVLLFLGSKTLVFPEM